MFDFYDSEPRHWLVTGGAGFIGSHIVEFLLESNQRVTSLDNLSTGRESNLLGLKETLEPEKWDRLTILTGDLADESTCREAVAGVDRILHQGALGSVPRSMKDPLASHRSNVTGAVNLFTAAKESGVRRIVYASSSSVYGDEPNLPKIEDRTGNLLSPYAATKAICEKYANGFARAYDMEIVGLRYFNVFGPRQDPNGAYAAVIPLWVKSMIQGDPVYINGDGETSRDFTYVAEVVQANIRAALVPELADPSRVFNVALGGSVTLNALFERIRELLRERRSDLDIPDPVYRDFRPGDVRHSQADTTRLRGELGFQPSHDVADGLAQAMDWYLENV